MGKKRSYLQGQIENTNSELYGKVDSLGVMPTMPKLSQSEQDEIANEIEKEKEIERQLEENELKIKQEEEAKKLEPKTVIEQQLLSTGNEKEYKGYKDIKQKIADLEALNPIKSADKETAFLDTSGQKNYTDREGVIRMGKYSVNFKSPLYSLLDGVTPDNYGMSDKQKQEYKELIAQRRAIELPLAAQLEAKYSAEYNEEVKKSDAFLKSLPNGVPMNPFNKDTDSIRGINRKHILAKELYEKNLKVLRDFKDEKDGVLDGLGNFDNTVGIGGVILGVDMYNIKKKAQAGETLTPEEEQLTKAYNFEQQTQALNLGANRFFYRTGEGTAHSAEFMAQIILTAPIGGAGGAVAKAVVTPLAERIALKTLTTEIGTNLTKTQLAKLAAVDFIEGATITTGNLLTQAAVIPMTYQGAAKKFIGQTQLVTDINGNEKVLVTASARKAYEKQAANDVAILKGQENELINKPVKSEQDLQKIQTIRDRIADISLSLETIYDPNTGDILKDVGEKDAAIYGYTETAKELVAERFVGGAIDKLGLGRRLAGTKVGKAFAPVTRRTAQGIEMINSTALGKLSAKAAQYTGGAKVFNGLPGEVAEEIAVQLTPTYQEDYSKQLESLYDFSHDAQGKETSIKDSQAFGFYTDVVAQTLLMQGGSTLLGTGKHAYNYSTSKEYRDQYKKDQNNRKEIQALYKNIDRAVSDDNLAEHIVMNTGNSLFELKDYQRKVAELRGKNTPEATEEADRLEKKSFTNFAIKALETNTLDSFERSLARVATNENVSEVTKANAASAKQVITALRKTEDHRGKVNYAQIANLSINKVLAGQTIADLNKKLAKIKEDGKDSINKFNTQKGRKDTKDIDSILDELESDTVDTEQAGNYVNYINSLRDSNIGNIEEYLQTRNFIKQYEQIDFENEVELGRQTNPANQSQFIKEYKKAKEDRLIEDMSTLPADRLYEVSRELSNELEPDEEPLAQTTVRDGKQYLRILNNKTGEIREAELTADNKILKTVAKRAEEIKAQEIIVADPILPTAEIPAIVETSEPLTPETNQALGLAALLDPNYQNESPLEMGQEYFSRRSLKDSITPEHPQYEKIVAVGTAIANRLDAFLERTANLQDFIEDFVKQSSYKEVETKYNGLLEIWKATGRDISDAEGVYNTVFGVTAALDLSELILTPEQVTEQVKETTSTLVTPTEFNLDGKPVSTDADVDKRIASSINKAAFNFMDSQRIGETEFVVVSSQLKTDPIIDNFYALLPDFVQEDNELDVQILDNDTIPVTGYKKDGTPVKMTWGAYKQLHNITDTTSDAYINKVPMVAYKGSTPVFYIHDIGWWNDYNVTSAKGEAVKQQLIQEGIDNTKNIRSNVSSGNNKITITNRSFGSIDSLVEHADSSLKTINDATGDSTLVMWKDGMFKRNNAAGPLELDLVNITNKVDESGDTMYQEGQIFDVRHVSTTKEGVKKYIALPTITPSPVDAGNLKGERLNQVAFNNIKFAVIANSLLVNADNELIRAGIEAQYKVGMAHANNIREAILKSTGIDITNNLQNYVELFTNTYNSGSNNISVSTIAKTADKNKKGQDKFPIGKTYIKGFNPRAGSTGSITVFHKDSHLESEDKAKSIQLGEKVTNNKENAHFKALDVFLNDTNGILKDVQINVNTKFLHGPQSDKNMVSINAQGQVSEIPGNYEHFLKGVLQTNIVSHKIQDTQGKDVWITDVQPKINFALTSEVNLEEKPSAPKTVAEKIENASQAVIAEDMGVDLEAQKKALETLPEHLREAFLRQNRTETDINDDFFSRRTRTPEQDADLDNTASKLISTLNSEEQKTLLNSVQHKIIAGLDFTNSDISLQDIKNKIVSSINDYVLPQINTYKEIVENLAKVEGLEGEVAKFNALITKLEAVVNEQEKLVSFNPHSKGQLTRNFERLFGGNLEDLIDTEEDSQSDNYSISFLEQDLKLSFSTALKLSLFGYEKLNKNNQKSFNFANLEEYESADDVDLALKEITTDLDSNWDLFMNRLESVAKERGKPIFLQLRNRLKDSPEHLRNELLYKTISSKLTLYKVLYSHNEAENTYILDVIDENSSKELVKLPNQFKSNFIYTSPFGELSSNGDIKLNKVYAKAFTARVDKLMEKYKAGFEINTENLKIFRDLLEEIGITIDNNAIAKFATENNPFTNTGIIGTANRYMKNLHNEDKDVILTAPAEGKDFYKNIGTILKKLVSTQIALNGTQVAKSIRVDGKTMQGTIEKTMVYEIARDLVPTEVDGKLVTSSTFNILNAVPYSKGSYILELLKNNTKFRDAFSVDFSSPESSKVNGKKSFADRDFDKVSLSDNMITSLALFSAKMNNVQIEDSTFGGSIVKDLSFRMGQMTFPALADKGRMLYLRTALLNLKDKDIRILDGKVNLSEPVGDFLAENLFNSEFRRVIMSLRNEDTNVVGFDKAAKLFIGLPILNEIEVNGVNIHTLLNTKIPGSEQMYYEQDIDTLIAKFKEPAIKAISEVIQNEVTNKLSADGNSGEWVDAKLFDNTKEEGFKLRHIDSNFVAEKTVRDNLSTAHTIAADFVINNLLNQSNVYKLFLGDMAYFSKDKMIKSTSEGTIDYSEMLNDNNYAEFAKAVSIVVDKRAAMLIAPGKKLANSDVKGQDEYIQVQVNDVSSVSSVIKSLMQQQYGEITPRENELLDALDTNQKQLDEAYANNTDTSVLKKDRKNIIQELKSSNSELEKYFDIEGTDAQEYTTWSTHIDMLLRQGRLTRKERDSLVSAYDKMSEGRFDEVTPEEISNIMQPVKPVATGSIPVRNKAGELISNRTIYIKSSSIPLIPQLTKNLQLDEVRKKLERLEKETGKMVRMSYQTANKIGAVNTALNVEDLYYRTFEELYSKDEEGNAVGLLNDSAVTLQTKNFKIQQETPSKTEKFVKKNKDNYITMGSQFWKVILGNGINKNGSYVFPNKFSQDLLDAVGVTPKDGMITGRDLDKIDFHIYKEYSGIQKKSLYTDLDMDPDKPFHTLDVDSKNDVVKKLTALLKKEIIERGHPEYLQEAINLVTGPHGILETEMPLFLDASSNKFEALLQAIISTRLISHKLPGNGHISASSEGFRRKETLENLSAQDRTGIVWFDPNHKGELKATFKDGKIIESEVLIRPHYRVTYRDANNNLKTKLIDLTSDEYSSVIVDSEGKVTGRKLRLEKIDPELLSQFSFRIPTSSHQSGVIIKVAGFLPPQVGDLLVVPKEHTTQLGEDYDIDKRYVYKSNYVINRDGVINKLQYSASQLTTEEKKEVIYSEYKANKEALKTELLGKIQDKWYSNREKLIRLAFAKNELEMLEGKDPLVDRMMGAFFPGFNLEDEFVALVDEIEALENEIISSADLKASQGDLRKELKDTSEALLEAFRNEKYDNFKNYVSQSHVLKNKVKMLENGMIDIYKSVYESPSDEIQQKIFKPLSVQKAKDTANLMNDKIGKVANPFFTPFSDSYQRSLIKLGADGKGGIGVHSNAVTLQAQLERLEVPVRLLGKAEPNSERPLAIEKIGKYISDGTLGRIETLDGERSISDVHGENQNSSTDNINEQVMGKRNENAYTMGVFALMAHRGFDLTEEFNINGKKGRLQLTSLFMNQPILRRYVELRQEFDSMTAQYSKEVEEDIVAQLFQEFHATPTTSSYSSLDNLLGKEEYDKLSTSMTGANLWDSLNGNDVVPNLQVAVLQKFLRFKSEADSLREYQQLINLSTSKLGISYFEVLQRIAVLDRLTTEEGYSNLADLVGKHELYDPENVERNKELVSEGYTLLGDHYWLPTTKEGVMLINSLKTANDVMEINFPYEEAFVSNMLSNIFYVKGEDINKKSTANLKWKYEIISEFKDFLNTSEEIGIYNGDTNVERARLFMDTAENKSLASFLDSLKRTKNPILKNSLLADLTPKVKTNGTPSLIEYITDYNTNFDKINKYDAFEELLSDNTTILGTWNGEQITPRMLAQDLATYSYLANNENGAVGFRNFIHLDYFKKMGITANFRGQLHKIKDDSDYARELLTRFVKQYFQHNPNRANILSSSSISADDISIPGNITPDEKKALDRLQQTKKGYLNTILPKLVVFKAEGVKVPFVSVRNTNIKKSDNQFNLYELKEGYYHRVPTLGTFGYNEYNANTGSQKGLLNIGLTETTIAANVYVDTASENAFSYPQASVLFQLGNGITSLLQQIYDSKATSDEYKKLIEDIQKYVKPNVQVELKDMPNGNFGSYNATTDTISINRDIYRLALQQTRNDFTKANNMVKEVILEEVMHSITVKEFKKYVAVENRNTGDITLKADAPIFATKLKALYDIAREEHPFNAEDPSTYYSKDIYEFMAGMFVAPDYREIMEAKSVGFVKRFADMLRNLLGSIFNSTTGQVLPYNSEVFSNVFELLKANKAEGAGIELTGVNPMKAIIEADTTVIPTPNKAFETPKEISEEEAAANFMKLFSQGGLQSKGEEFDSRNRLPEIKNCK